MLTKRKANELDTAMKTPASKKSLAKAEPKQKAIVKKNAEEAKHVTPAFLKGIYGCVRCRGSVSGCDKCQSPYFGGTQSQFKAGIQQVVPRKAAGEQKEV
jgi:hypothetical protein